jgi:hypothetical protein
MEQEQTVVGEGDTEAEHDESNKYASEVEWGGR